MQNRYAGDIGDYIKLALLRHLSIGKKVGVVWYAYPDESHNSDGRHIQYLSDPERWRHLDADLFDILTSVVSSERSIAALQRSGALKAVYASAPILSANLPASERADQRSYWFKNAQKQLESCDLIFADPDNGIVDDADNRRRQKVFGKQIPLSEVKEISNNRTAVIYHHNTRFKGGHDAEVAYWLSELDVDAVAVRANAYSCRTFFVINPDIDVLERVKTFCNRWANHKVKLHL